MSLDGQMVGVVVLYACSRKADRDSEIVSEIDRCLCCLCLSELYIYYII